MKLSEIRDFLLDEFGNPVIGPGGVLFELIDEDDEEWGYRNVNLPAAGELSEATSEENLIILLGQGAFDEEELDGR